MKKRTKSYSREFKLEAVRLSHESDRTVAEVADELGLSKSSLFRWRHELADDPDQAFPGQGRMKERDAEIARLRQELRNFIHQINWITSITITFVHKGNNWCVT